MQYRLICLATRCTSRCWLFSIGFIAVARSAESEVGHNNLPMAHTCEPPRRAGLKNTCSAISILHAAHCFRARCFTLSAHDSERTCAPGIIDISSWPKLCNISRRNDDYRSTPDDIVPRFPRSQMTAILRAIALTARRRYSITPVARRHADKDFLMLAFRPARLAHLVSFSL